MEYAPSKLYAKLMEMPWKDIYLLLRLLIDIHNAIQMLQGEKWRAKRNHPALHLTKQPAR